MLKSKGELAWVAIKEKREKRRRLFELSKHCVERDHLNLVVVVVVGGVLGGQKEKGIEKGCLGGADETRILLVWVGGSHGLSL